MEMVMLVKENETEKINEKLKTGWTVKECRPVVKYNLFSGMGDSTIHTYFILERE